MTQKTMKKNLPAVVHPVESTSDILKRVPLLMPLVRTLQTYHRHQVVGLRNLPKS